MASILEPIIQLLNNSIQLTHRLLRRFINYGNLINKAPTLNTEYSTLILHEINKNGVNKQMLLPLLVYSSGKQWHMIFVDSMKKFVCQDTLPIEIKSKLEALDKNSIYKLEDINYK